MQLHFNNESIHADVHSLLEFLEVYRLSDKNGIAVAVNDNVIPRSKWSEHTLQENDSILVITAAAGG